MPDDDRVRLTVRLPQDAYDNLCEELSCFSTDTARLQFLTQFYLDYKRQTAPGKQCECRSGFHMPPNAPAYGEEHRSADEQSPERPSETATDEAAPPRNSEDESNTQLDQQDQTDHQQSSKTETTTDGNER